MKREVVYPTMQCGIYVFGITQVVARYQRANTEVSKKRPTSHLRQEQFSLNRQPNSVMVGFLISVTVLIKVVSSEPFFDIKDPAFIEECVREHNVHRTSVEPSASYMRYMVNMFLMFLIRDQQEVDGVSGRVNTCSVA